MSQTIRRLIGKFVYETRAYMYFKPRFKSFKEKRESPVWFWIICSLTGVYTCTALIFFLSSTTNYFEVADEVGLLAISFLTIYEIIVMRLMPNHIVKHFSIFRPALDLPDSDYSNLLKQILSATISIKYLWLLISTILLNNVFIVLYNRHVQLFYPTTLIHLIITSFFMLYTMSRVLRHVYKLQKFPLKVNILNTKPLLTLSQLTQKFAFYLLPVTTFFGWVGIYSVLNNDPYSWTNILLKIVFFTFISMGPLLLILSVCIFVLPVLWVRRLIIERKMQALSNIAQKLLTSFHEHDKMIETGDLSNINAITTSINALTSRAETYNKISELPWETQTLREFLGAVILPIMLWITQYYLGSFLAK
jgi:hypothetical protein